MWNLADMSTGTDEAGSTASDCDCTKKSNCLRRGRSNPNIQNAFAAMPLFLGLTQTSRKRCDVTVVSNLCDVAPHWRQFSRKLPVIDATSPNRIRLSCSRQRFIRI